MRLWHQFLIPHLDNKRLLGQHRECCALRGKGWGKKHSVVDYVFKHDLVYLYAYHSLVMEEMQNRGYSVYAKWYSRTYRGKKLPPAALTKVGDCVNNRYYITNQFDIIENICCDEDRLVYPEHDISYLKECLLNLKAKNAILKGKMSIDELLVKIDLLSS